MALRPALTMHDVRELPFEELLARLDAVLAEYDPPDVEVQPEKLRRITRTLDEMPVIYRWLQQWRSWLDHWTDANARMFGMKDDRYKAQRQRRDLLEQMASAAKMRYEGASRQITVMQDFDESGMPRQRKGD